MNEFAGHFRRRTSGDALVRALSRGVEFMHLKDIPEEVRQETRQISFSDFVREAWHTVEPHTVYEHNWHIDAVGVLLTKVEAGDITRAVLNLPPRHMKSLLVSVFWPCWLWTRAPGTRFIFGSFSDDLARKHSVDRRTVIESEWYQSHWGHIVKLTHDTNRQDEFMNTARGHMIATSVGSSPTGKGADIIVVDDPHDPEKVESDTERLKAVRWFTQKLSNRLDTDKGKIVIVMQRLHEEDVAGVALKRFKFYRMKIPAIEEAPRDGEQQQVYELPDGRKVRRKIGSVLWPARFGRSFMAERKLIQGDDGFAKQYQQEPTGKSGTIFNVDAIRPWAGGYPGQADYERRVVARTRGWDTAATEDARADFTVGTRLALLDDGAIVIEDVVREQLEPDEVDKLIAATAEMDRRLGSAPYSVREEQEPGSSGKTVVRFRARFLPPGLDYQGVPVDKNKTARARPFASAIRMSRVHAFMQADWWPAYKEELRLFPNGVHDDQVDASSCAYNHLGLAMPTGDIQRKVGV